jgi:Big-like domain-containing protein
MMKKFFVVVILGLGAYACGSSSTAPTPVLNALTVTCGGPLTSAGQQLQCTATAALSNGTRQDQTRAAQWSSSNASIATVSSSGMVTAGANGTATISAAYQASQGSQAITVSVPLAMTSYAGAIVRTRSGSGYLIAGTINITLNHAIDAPPPSSVRAEWENSLVGGTTDYSAGATQLQVSVSQATVACPNITNSPPDYLRLVDVGRQVVLARGVFTWSSNLSCP